MKTTTKKTGAKAQKGKPGKTTQRKASTAKTRRPTTKPDRQARSGTKQETIIAMLHSKAGATIPAIIKVTGWQPHSVRGFLSGHVRKKLGLTVDRQKADEESVYRIVAAKPRSRSAGKGKR